MGIVYIEARAGTITLEIFGLMLDPLKRVLRPIRAILK
jgi:hypothetical protein